MRPNKACSVVLSSARLPRILLFRHPQAGVQLVRGTIEKGKHRVEQLYVNWRKSLV